MTPDLNRPDCSSAEFFEELYRHSEDPWQFRSSSYEHSKYSVTLAALSREHYSSAFEPGCAIGEMTALLAPRCDHLIATDISPTAVMRARARCAAFLHVEISCQDVRDNPPAGQFDLILLCEIAYYFNVEVLQMLAKQLSERLTGQGELVAVHWRGHSKDHVLHADEAHRALHIALPLKSVEHSRHPGYQLDRWIKA